MLNEMPTKRECEHKTSNPFESGQIKNYLLLYASVVVIMVLFFLATTLFSSPKKEIKQREFKTELPKKSETETSQSSITKETHFKLLKSAY